MSEQGNMLFEMADRLFGDLAERGDDPAGGWRSIERLGLADLFRAEAEGGMAGSWCDAEPVFRLIGYHALSLPIGETMIARRLLSGAGEMPEGAIAIGKGRGELSDAGNFTGDVRALTGSAVDAWLLAVIESVDGDVCLLIDPGYAKDRRDAANVAGEPRATFAFDGVPARWAEGVSRDAILQSMAFLSTAQTAGALAACLERCIRYSQERSQFGRELRRFQAIQHQIALIAEEAAAIAAASASAAVALDRGEAAFEVACAKLRANQATGACALIAHQVHGAIGITEEFDLHRFTNRLWAWRSEFGNDRFWAQRLGRHMLAAPSSPWKTITARARS